MNNLMNELIDLQNALVAPVDILTITGFMNDAELLAHVERYRKIIANQ